MSSFPTFAEVLAKLPPEQQAELRAKLDVQRAQIAQLLDGSKSADDCIRSQIAAYEDMEAKWIAAERALDEAREEIVGMKAELKVWRDLGGPHRASLVAKLVADRARAELNIAAARGEASDDWKGPRCRCGAESENGVCVETGVAVGFCPDAVEEGK